MHKEIEQKCFSFITPYSILVFSSAITSNTVGPSCNFFLDAFLAKSFHYITQFCKETNILLVEIMISNVPIYLSYIFTFNKQDNIKAKGYKKQFFLFETRQHEKVNDFSFSIGRDEKY